MMERWPTQDVPFVLWQLEQATASHHDPDLNNCEKKIMHWNMNAMMLFCETLDAWETPVFLHWSQTTDYHHHM